MTLTLTIDMDNEAFQDGNAGNEVARILQKVAAEFEEVGHPQFRRLYDYNGNRVGEITVAQE